MKHLWTGDHPDVMRLNMVSLAVNFIPQVLLLPFAYILYYFCPQLGIFKFYHTPMMKFYGDCVAYFLFLGLLIFDTTHAHRLLEGRSVGEHSKITLSFVL